MNSSLPVVGILQSLDRTIERFERAANDRGRVDLSKLQKEARALGLKTRGSIKLEDVQEVVLGLREDFRSAAGRDRLLKYVELAGLDTTALGYLDFLVEKKLPAEKKLKATTAAEVHAAKREVLSQIRRGVKADDGWYHEKDAAKLAEPARSFYLAIIEHYRGCYNEYAATKMPAHLLEQPMTWAAADLLAIRSELYPGIDNPRGSANDVADLVTKRYGSDRWHRDTAGQIAKMLFEQLKK